MNYHLITYSRIFSCKLNLKEFSKSNNKEKAAAQHRVAHTMSKLAAVNIYFFII